jgi:hypothetical protein
MGCIMFFAKDRAGEKLLINGPLSILVKLKVARLQTHRERRTK